MKGLSNRVGLVLFLTTGLAQISCAQKALSWSEVRQRFEVNNPTLRAGQLGIDESKANEITAYLRPNPQASIGVDQIGDSAKAPFREAVLLTSVNYLHERRHKRELRLESAQDATKIAVSSQEDLDRTLIFSLRTAFVQTLQGKAVLDLARENLTYYDHVLDVNRERYKAGAIARVDLDRLEIQRVTYESDLQTAEVNLRTAKIQLLALLNDRTPVEQFDVTGLYDFSRQIPTLDEVRQTAVDSRPDLRAALQAIDKAKTDHRLAVAMGSTDPTINIDAAFPGISSDPVNFTPFLHEYVGVGFSIPLRIFDRNQGEKLRTQLDIDRNEKLMEATRATVFSDVDSAHATVTSTVILLQPYKDRYLQQASSIRDTIAFSYEHGAASLLDFLNAQAEYRGVQLNYLNLVGSYLVAASQLNMAVGREVIP